MNSGEIVIATTSVDAAAAAVAVATVASAAVLVVRTVNAAAPPAAHTVGAEHKVGGADAAPPDAAGGRGFEGDSAAQWDAAAALVVAVNARIRMFGAQADRTVDVGSDAVEPVCLEGLTAANAAQRAARAAAQLAAVRAAVRAAIAADERRDVVTLLPHSVASHPDVDATLAKFQDTLSRRHGPEHLRPVSSSALAAGGGAEPGTDAETEQLLLALDQDANDAEHREVLGAAAQVIRDDPREARARISGLRMKVGAVNEAVSRRRLAACWLSALEEPTIAAVEPPGPLRGVAARLRRIVAGDDDLTPESRAQAAEAVAWAADVARQRFVRDMTSACLTEQGYVVDGEPDPENSGELRLTRAEWNGEHSVEIWLDRHGAVHGRLVSETRAPSERRRAGNGGDAIERSRVARFNADLNILSRRLHSDVVTDAGYVPRDEAAGARRPPPAAPETRASEA